jgi:AcrR family transcriptional regulator
MEIDDAMARWVEAGLAELAHGGIDAVRVEVLAARLGVTKGGFYRRFKDRRALLDALLETWVRGREAAIEEQTELAKDGAGERLKSLIQLYSERVSAHGIAIELAIRQWARSDPSKRRRGPSCSTPSSLGIVSSSSMSRRADVRTSSPSAPIF